MVSAPRPPTLPLAPLIIPEVFTDSRTHGYSGPLRTVHLAHISSNGGAIAKNDDGTRCVVAGEECT
jgi:WD repeat-containing protein 24